MLTKEERESNRKVEGENEGEKQPFRDSKTESVQWILTVVALSPFSFTLGTPKL